MTGSAGFLGSRIVTDLPDQAVRALVHRRVPYLPNDRQVELELTGGVEPLAAALDGVESLIHLAGHNEVVAASDPDRALAETLVMARHVAEAARACGVSRVVYVSTVHVYGARMTDTAVLSEDVPPQPQSIYAITRLACEHLLAQAGLDVVVLRLTNAVGAPADARVQRWTLVAADLCRQAITSGSLVLRTAGLQWRDFVDLGDVARIVTACARPGGVPAGTYNLGTGRCLTVRELAGLVQDAFARRTGRRPDLHTPPPDGPPPQPYRVSVDRLTGQGLTAQTSVSEAVDALATFCLDHKDDL